MGARPSSCRHTACPQAVEPRAAVASRHARLAGVAAITCLSPQPPQLPQSPQQALVAQTTAVALAGAATRGVPPPRKRDGVTVAGFDEELPEEVSTTPDFLCGAGSAIINIMVTFPANKLMFRQQVDGLAIGPAFRAMQREGLKSLYKGVGPPLLQKTTSLSLMFGMYAWYGKQLGEHTSLPDVAVGPAAAVLSGATEALLTPFERVQTLLQLPSAVRRHDHTAHAFMDLRRYGLREYYRGMSAIVFRNTLSNAMFFGLRGPLRDSLPGASDHCQWCAPLRDFVSGAMLGALISTVFFPINVAKSVMQRRVGGTFRGATWTLRDVYRARGSEVSQLYRGVSVNFMRALVSWGIINSAYEFLMEHAVGRPSGGDADDGQ